LAAQTDRDRLLDYLLTHGWAWDEALQVARGEPFLVTVGGITWRWLPEAARRFGVAWVGHSSAQNVSLLRP
jgi:hypothetical protein